MRSILKGDWILKIGSVLSTGGHVMSREGISATCCSTASVYPTKQALQVQTQRNASTCIPTAAATVADNATSTQSQTPVVTPAFQPLTDKFGRHHTYLRISLTERCNLRCKYCMPAEGVSLQPKSNLLTTDEIVYLARIFVEQGVRKIRLTGGEPTVRRDIVEIIERIKSIPKLENVGITTNGLVLTRFLVPMQRAGLDAINISLDTLRSERFEEITRRKGWERVIAGIDLAIQLGYTPKINCVLMRNFNEDEICDFVEFTKDRNVDIRFIEYMPFMGNKWQTDKLFSYRETLEVIRRRWPDFVALPNGPNDTSKAFKVPGYSGQVGFITSMTEHFCGTCNRLRLTADGNIKVCLFGNKEFSLRDAIRNNCAEEDLVELISVAVKRKRKQHADKLNCVSLFQRHHHSNYHHQCKSKDPVVLQAKQPSTILGYGRQMEQFLNVLQVGSGIKFNSLGLHRRYYCKSAEKHLTHVDREGKATMVDVSEKRISEREAVACATVQVGARIAQLIAENNIRKGDVLTVAQIAGILGAKKTAELIPLCHNIPLSSVKVHAELQGAHNCVKLTARVRCTAQTGVEMEALTAVSVAALTVYDMCKAVSHDITITDIRLESKTGGKSDFVRCGSSD